MMDGDIVQITAGEMKKVLFMLTIARNVAKKGGDTRLASDMNEVIEYVEKSFGIVKYDEAGSSDRSGTDDSL